MKDLKSQKKPRVPVQIHADKTIHCL